MTFVKGHKTNVGRRKQFCPRGHDTFICGRSDDKRCCNQCYDEDHPCNPKVPWNKGIQFCPEGHDTFVVGRTEYGCCIICYQNYQIDYREEHKQEKILYNIQYYKDHKEECDAKKKIYRKKHPGMYQLMRLKHKTKRGLRVVEWGQEGILEFYEKCHKSKVVDHFIPLCGRKVSGLHVIWNLQYLTPKQNNKKKIKCNLLEASEWYGKLLEEEGLK